MRTFFLNLLLFLISAAAFCEVTPPNYNFSLDQFNTYLPGKNLDILAPDIKKSFFTLRGKNTIYRFWVRDHRYKFPLFVQTNAEGRILDFYARLPNYFLHDSFHQGLINRFGKQNKFIKKEELAVYIWDQAQGLERTEIVYSGTCTITCFPVFLTYISSSEKDADKTYQSLVDWAGQSGLSNFNPASLRN